MTTPDLKELAKKAAEFCGLNSSMRPEKGKWYYQIQNEETVYFTPENMFHGVKGAILMHLAKREAKRQGFKVCTNDNQVWVGKKSHDPYHWPHDAKWIKKENEFIAFWTALLEATR